MTQAKQAEMEIRKGVEIAKELENWERSCMIECLPRIAEP